MTFPEGEFYDTVTLARMYDTSKDVIREMFEALRRNGHEIEALTWGKQGKLKINVKQFRVALMREFKA
jgi:hypothetical protein